MLGLINLYWGVAEIFLGFAIINLLGFGVIYSKLGGKISQQRKLINLGAITLFFTAFLLMEELSSIKDIVLEIGGPHGFVIESWSTIIKLAIAIIGGILLLVSNNFTNRTHEDAIEFEYVILYLIGVLGMFLLLSSNDLILMYLSIETLSLSLYVLAALNKSWEGSAEAGLKYFLLGALSSGLLIAGCVIVYLITAETNLGQIGMYIWYNTESSLGLEIGGILILVALLFKLGAAPFHMWVPDVYDGSPTYVTAYFAILPKLATLGLLFRCTTTLTTVAGWQSVLLLSGLLSIIIGSFGAINQTKIKRLLAYSAIAHMGFMLIALSLGTLDGYIATFVYMILYMIMSLNTFSVLLNKGYIYVTELSGISRKDPILASTLALGFLSIAGIPPLAGFLSKYIVLLSAVDSGVYLISIIAVITSVIGSFYYIRVVKWIYFSDSIDYLYKNLFYSISPYTQTLFGHLPSFDREISLINSITLGSTLYLILTIWIYPLPLLEVSFANLIAGAGQNALLLI